MVYQLDDEEQDFADDRPEDGSIVSGTDSDISDLSNEDEIGAFDVLGLGFLQFHPDNEGEGKSAGSILSHYSQSLYSTSGDEELSEYEPQFVSTTQSATSKDLFSIFLGTSIEVCSARLPSFTR